MKHKNEVPKPFRSGSCQACRQSPYVDHSAVCPGCLAFIIQDYGAQLDAVFDTDDFMEIADAYQDVWHEVRAAQYVEPCEKEKKRKHTVTLFSKAGLSRRERQIIKLIFAERLTFETVSNRLRITRGSVQTHVKRAVKKLHSCLTPALLVRGIVSPKPPGTHPKLSDNSKTRPTTLPSTNAPEGAPVQVVDHQALETEAAEYECRVRLLRACPRCRDRIFCTDRDYQYCFNCLWDSDTDGGV